MSLAQPPSGLPLHSMAHLVPTPRQGTTLWRPVGPSKRRAHGPNTPLPRSIPGPSRVCSALVAALSSAQPAAQHRTSEEHPSWLIASHPFAKASAVSPEL